MSDITYAYPLILNKVASPNYATPTLRRPRLIEWLNNAANCRATVLAADAGYGKTTLLWQWEREVDFPCYWYKLDRSDRDWTFHISYLIEAIAKRHPGFGTRAHSMLQQLGGPGSSRPGVAAYLLAEMHERLTEPCTFIIDDWQYVNAVTEVRGLWNQILRDAPPTCRFVFSSRAKPKLQFARFTTHNGYAELRTDSFRFTQDETAELFREIYNNPLDPSEVADLDRRTEGWAASLQMIEVSLRQRADPEDRRSFLQSIGSSSDSALFDFLAEEVLEQQSAQTRNFLLATSVLQQITPEIAERLAGVHDGRRELAELEQRGLFTNRVDEHRYRYHNLFREFLGRRLIDERTEAEVLGLHIHAASYFETSAQWPEAIHHYLRARLHRQAARLIATYGEDVASEGRLEHVDEWLMQLPAEAIRQNARISLLHGETSGMRGEWDSALSALRQAREYFARKGDRRLEALACLKLSSVLSNYGDADGAAEIAQSGLDLVPSDDVVTRLRLEGNLAITRTWLTQPLDSVVVECQRIAAEASSRGLEHYAAIARHNAGAALMVSGRIIEGVENLEYAARIWSAPPLSPFADNADLVVGLLLQGKVGRASQLADDAARLTRPWLRPSAFAQFGRAAVRAYEGRFTEAIRDLTEASASGLATGTAHTQLSARLVECLYLDDAEPERISAVATQLEAAPKDKRHELELAPAVAIGRHARGHCDASCLEMERRLSDPREVLTSALAGVKFGTLALQHGGHRRAEAAWRAARDAANLGVLTYLRWWLRKYVPYVASVLNVKEGVATLLLVAEADPDGWRSALINLLPDLVGPDRAATLALIIRYPNDRTAEGLRDVKGSDVADARRRLQIARASRLFLRTFGGVSIHRGSWDGAPIRIDKKRVRGLLGVLAAHAEFPLTRDAAVDMLWPEADAESGVNNLNQTVFQLRRYLDPGYRAGDSPDYVISTSDEVKLNGQLVRTDLSEIVRLPQRLAGANQQTRAEIVGRVVDLFRGEFLGDLRYEDWAARLQLTVHSEVRSRLMPFTDSGAAGINTDLSTRVATVLLLLDPFDEPALLALARALFVSGRRAAARKLVGDYIDRVWNEFGEEPSPEVAAIARSTELYSRSTPN